ncbi:hypothetical protein WOSG25_020300 [Weissella oryzae SG25]|uniref:Uncharacterized protein n=1 Tax=Weissella oryzae (strain DSM 25784 / JCM 18191 / LMG 30913 / SG25) TaxID=1329250 RepID=A0A069CR68_WEIOS|nr:DsrE family protein [Weissella oryzae]GAK30235.1 hypothetical protein WOSG25_020300 [Weissella oryzae SG25]
MLSTIFHIDERAKWSTVLSNLHHMVEWMDNNNNDGTVELLVNGEAVVDSLKNSKQDLSALVELGIDVRICRNSMSQRNILDDDLQNDLKIVPSGVVELALKQQEGFSYIKP